jgi:hypothetical protein
VWRIACMSYFRRFMEGLEGLAALKTRGGGNSTPGEIIAPAGFRNRN